MTKLQHFFTKYKKYYIALFIFVLCLTIFSISYTFAAVEPVRSIVIQSENTDFASGEEGSWQVTKSGYWTNYGEAEVTLDVDTSLMTNNEYTDIIFVLDTSESMLGNKLDRVKSDSKELISSLLSNQNNRAALINFDTSSQIVSELTSNTNLLINEINNLQAQGNTNYYQALVNVDNLLQKYQKESNRELLVLFLTDGYPTEDTPNQVGEYQYLKSTYSYITINAIQYEMGSSILTPLKEISDNQFIANTNTLNNILYESSRLSKAYETFQITDYIDNDNFKVDSVNDIKVTTGKVELTEESGRQKIIWTLDNNLFSGSKANLTIKLKLKDEFVGQGGVYPTNESTRVVTKIESATEDVTTANTPILADNYTVTYDGNPPAGCSVSNIPGSRSHSIFSTVEISSQIPKCSGYEFKGWDITNKDIVKIGKDYFTMPGSDVVIKAKWSKITISKSMDGTVNEKLEPIIKRYASNVQDDFRNLNYISKITSIVTKDNIEIPSYVVDSWDVSEAGNGSVIAYIENDGSGGYKLTIGGEGGIIANPDSSYLFGGTGNDNWRFANVETIDLTYLDTSRVTNMSRMFSYGSYSIVTSNNSKLHTIIFGDKWDTSQVTNMDSMFLGQEQLTNLDLNTWNTDQVIDIESMFAGCKNLIRLNMRNATFNATNYLLMFNAVPNGITITVKDNTAKTWIEARLREVNKTGNVIIG